MNLPFLGTDIVDIPRLGRMVKSKKFVGRVFTPEEIAYCSGKKNAAQHYAVRFAAKEAVWKSLSTHLKHQGVSHQEISVKSLEDGRPVVVLSKRLKKFEKKIALSLSHSKHYALAVAMFVE